MLVEFSVSEASKRAKVLNTGVYFSDMKCGAMYVNLARGAVEDGTGCIASSCGCYVVADLRAILRLERP